MATPDTHRLSLMAVHSSSLNVNQSNPLTPHENGFRGKRKPKHYARSLYFRTVKPWLSKKGAAFADFR
jgi:hypothetical protein